MTTIESVLDAEQLELSEALVARVIRAVGDAAPARFDDLIAQVAEIGVLGASVSERHGGLGMDDPRIAVALRLGAARAGASGPGIAVAELVQVALPACDALAANAGELEGLLAGTAVAAVVGGDGSIVAKIEDGRWSVTGRARPAVNAVRAQVVVVVAHDGGMPVVGLVAPDATGVTVGAELALVGPEELGAAVVEFDRAALAGAMTGPDAVELSERIMADQELLIAAGAVFDARTALEETAAYTSSRKAFGTPIADFQNTRLVLGDARASLAAAASLVTRAIQERIARGPDGGLSASARLAATSALARAVDTGLQLHGGYGYMLEYPISHAYTAARGQRLLGIRSEERLREAASAG